MFSSLTMYRTMLYFLGIVLGVAVLFSWARVLHYSAADIALQTFFLVAVCWGINEATARLFKVKPNPESSIITALILSLIAGPFPLQEGWGILAAIAVAAIASKYVLVFHRAQVFNPAAFGTAVGALVFGQSATWWVGDTSLLPLIFLGGLWVVFKIRRIHLVLSFFAAYLGLFAFQALFLQGREIGEVAVSLWRLLSFSPLFFFAFVMLVEPLTSPQMRFGRILFGALVGSAFFFIPRFFSGAAFPLGLSLLAGNVFARLASPVFTQVFLLQKKEALSSSISGFWFEPTRPFAFVPGQFLEYTLWHKRPDSRGIRRYFTIASSSTEKQILLTTRFSEKGSTFKRALVLMETGQEIVASRVAGDFVLPHAQSQKLAFVAGGIGITPFRSMVKYLLDTNQSRDIVLLYGARSENDFVFRELFEEAGRKFGIKSVYAAGPLDKALISKEIPDFAERIFYVSGPESMVEAMEGVLKGMGIFGNRVKRDYFPGYA